MSYQSGRPAWQRTRVVFGKVDRHVVARHWIRVDVASTGEDGRPRVDQNGPPRLARQAVNVGERRAVGPVGVGGHLHVGRVQLDPAEAVDVEKSLHVGGDVAGVPRVDSPDRDEPVAVSLDVARDPGVHEVGDPYDLGSHGVDQGRSSDSLGVHRLQKLVGRAPNTLEEIQVVPPIHHDAAGPLVHLVIGTDVNVGVEDGKLR